MGTNVFQSTLKIHVFHRKGTIIHFHVFQAIFHTQGVANIAFLLDALTHDVSTLGEVQYNLDYPDCFGHDGHDAHTGLLDIEVK